MHNDEEATHAKLTALLTDAVVPAIAEHGDRIVKNTGDGFLAEFPTRCQWHRRPKECPLWLRRKFSLSPAPGSPQRSFIDAAHDGDARRNADAAGRYHQSRRRGPDALRRLRRICSGRANRQPRARFCRGCRRRTIIPDVTLSRSSWVTPAVTAAQAALSDAMSARDRECKGGVGRFCREREATVVDRRLALDTAMQAVGQTADPQTDAAARIVAWISHGLLRPTGDDFAMLRLILLALLPQIGGILLMVARWPQAPPSLAASPLA